MPLYVFRAVLLSGASWLPYIAIVRGLATVPAPSTSSAPPLLS